MALRGTLDTFALPDVLRLLGATSKSGRLRITGDRGTGSVWVESGEVTAVDATHAPHAQGTIDALFELLRFQDGSFTFDAGSAADKPGTPTDVEQLLDDSEALLAEWREIERVIPSMDLWVTLQRSLPGPEITLDNARWATVVAIGAGATVRRIGDELCLGELPISRAIRDLVEVGLVEIADTAPAVAPPDRGAVVEVAPLLPTPEADDDAFSDLDESGDLPEDADDDPTPEAAPTPAPTSGPRAKRARGLAASADAPSADTGLFVPLDLPGHGPAKSYDAKDEPAVAAKPAPKPAARLVAKPVLPKAAVAETVPSKPAKAAAAADAPPADLDELVAAFPGLADDEEIAKQLATLSPRAASAIRAATAAAQAEASDDNEDAPLSRGLLLKFLSSVKS